MRNLARKKFRSGAGQASSKVRILLVDENRLDLDFHARILAQLGCHVVACQSYTEAVQNLDSGKFDLIVVEQGGPNFKARCVLERARKPGQQVPVVVIANSADMEIYLDAMEMGAIDYLEKTSNVTALIHILNHALRTEPSADRRFREKQAGARQSRGFAAFVAFILFGLSILAATIGFPKTAMAEDRWASANTPVPSLNDACDVVRLHEIARFADQDSNLPDAVTTPMQKGLVIIP